MVLHNYYTYIMAHPSNNVLYVGVTNDLVRRVFEHKGKMIPGFTSEYNVTKLVYFERFDFIELAINREKQVKKYSKLKKVDLITKMNPNWIDMYEDGNIKVPSK